MVSVLPSSAPPASLCSSSSTTRAPDRAAVSAAARPVGSRADDQHVGVDVRRVVLRGVGDLGEATLARNAPCGKPVEQFDGGGEQHRLGKRVLDLDEAAGVLGPRGGEAARPAQLDAGGHLVNAVGQQRRCERVTGVPGQLLVVEDEGVGGAAVDAPTLRGCGTVRSWGGRPLLVRSVHALEPVGGGVADGVEPAAAARAVAPALREEPLRVGAEEHVVCPLLVGQRLRVFGVGTCASPP